MTDTGIVYWGEPHPARDADGNEIDAHVTSSATVQDCINMMRYIVHHGTGAGLVDTACLSDVDLLDSFMATNWAYIGDKD